jgi:hypothetical protein
MCEKLEKEWEKKIRQFNFVLFIQIHPVVGRWNYDQ